MSGVERTYSSDANMAADGLLDLVPHFPYDTEDERRFVDAICDFADRIVRNGKILDLNQEFLDRIGGSQSQQGSSST